jgi:hypothetical protein
MGEQPTEPARLAHRTPPPSELRHGDLTDALALVAGALEPDDELAASLGSSTVHAVVARAREQDGRAVSTTAPRSALSSVRESHRSVSHRSVSWSDRSGQCSAHVRESHRSVSWSDRSGQCSVHGREAARGRPLQLTHRRRAARTTALAVRARSQGRARAAALAVRALAQPAPVFV